MTKEREALKLALEALDSDNPDIQLRAAIIIKGVLAQPERPPATEGLLREIAALSANALDDYKMIQSLMAEREPLTRERLLEMADAHCGAQRTFEDWVELFGRAIEAAHGIGKPA